MIIYTVHEPQRPGQSIEARADSIVFVKEGFTIWGFLFGPLWLLYNRLWLAFVVTLVLMAALAGVLPGAKKSSSRNCGYSGFAHHRL